MHIAGELGQRSGGALHTLAPTACCPRSTTRTCTKKNRQGRRRRPAPPQRGQGAFGYDQLTRIWDPVPKSSRPRALATVTPEYLVVEDEEGLAQDQPGRSAGPGGLPCIHRVPDGLAGLKRQHLTFRPELIITDILMPIMDGVEMVRTLRASETRSLKVMFHLRVFRHPLHPGGADGRDQTLRVPHAGQTIPPQPPVRHGAPGPGHLTRRAFMAKILDF